MVIRGCGEEGPGSCCLVGSVSGWEGKKVLEGAGGEVNALDAIKPYT